MKNYKWVLFDADETLFHFDSFLGLQRMFAQRGITYTAQDFVAYDKLNRSLWHDYQQGLINIDQLKEQRFADWALRLNCSGLDLNASFIDAMAQICTPLDGALSLLKYLKGKMNIGIVTNGFTQIQQPRLERTGVKQFIDLLVVSEEVGIPKPHKGIFDHSLVHMGNPDPKEVLMVGDSLDSDILGGLNAGMETCWLNRKNHPADPEIKPHYEVTSLQELAARFLSVL